MILAYLWLLFIYVWFLTNCYLSVRILLCVILFTWVDLLLYLLFANKIYIKKTKYNIYLSIFLIQLNNERFSNLRPNSKIQTTPNWIEKTFRKPLTAFQNVFDLISNHNLTRILRGLAFLTNYFLPNDTQVLYTSRLSQNWELIAMYGRFYSK